MDVDKPPLPTGAQAVPNLRFDPPRPLHDGHRREPFFQPWHRGVNRLGTVPVENHWNQDRRFQCYNPERNFQRGSNRPAYSYPNGALNRRKNGVHLKNRGYRSSSQKFYGNRRTARITGPLEEGEYRPRRNTYRPPRVQDLRRQNRREARRFFKPLKQQASVLERPPTPHNTVAYLEYERKNGPQLIHETAQAPVTSPDENPKAETDVNGLNSSSEQSSQMFSIDSPMSEFKQADESLSADNPLRGLDLFGTMEGRIKLNSSLEEEYGAASAENSGSSESVHAPGNDDDKPVKEKATQRVREVRNRFRLLTSEEMKPLAPAAPLALRPGEEENLRLALQDREKKIADLEEANMNLKERLFVVGQELVELRRRTSMLSDQEIEVASSADEGSCAVGDRFAHARNDIPEVAPVDEADSMAENAPNVDEATSGTTPNDNACAE